MAYKFGAGHFRREATFKRGELRKAVADVLRKEHKPLTTRQITDIVMAKRGVDISDYRSAKQRRCRVLHTLKRMNLFKPKSAEEITIWTTRV